MRWIHGDAAALPAIQVDLATMTGNVAQAIVDPPDWEGTLRGVYECLRPGGISSSKRVIRSPEDQEHPRDPRRGGGRELGRLTGISGPLVSFRWTWVFASDGAVLTSDSTLRFRERVEVEEALVAAGYSVEEVRGAPDRPGREFVFFARRPS